jgi:hypothetical protein
LKYKLLITLIIHLISIVSLAETPQDSTKQGYTFFKRTPSFMMRSFSTDRPDATESPYTVDAGHFQYETDLFKYERLSFADIKSERSQFNVFNLKAGITNSLDIHFIVESFVHEKTTIGTAITNTSGFGNIGIRAKQNLWGNDHGKTAMAILPYINIPKGSEEKITAGLVLPVSVALANDWSFGVQVGFDVVNNEIVSGYHVNMLGSATLSHPLSGKFDFFAESLVYRETGLNTYEYFINTGLVYQLKKRLTLDGGVYYGLKNKSAKTYFIGLSFRC